MPPRQNKTRIDNPLLTNEDGPVYQLRRWYEQFCVDVADVTPEMVDRFEFELDTTRPVEAWKQEVADNIARKAAQDHRLRRGDASDRPPDQLAPVMTE